ncbi:unnamed protein product [Brugia timori]|uniref:Ovule protein n=1 Tax=Brugia timori TaxID=42155 RepID=A0A0R3QX06_9BILA|nr:unnamed protein product [Brugia timori]
MVRLCRDEELENCIMLCSYQITNSLQLHILSIRCINLMLATCILLMTYERHTSWTLQSFKK